MADNRYRPGPVFRCPDCKRDERTIALRPTSDMPPAKKKSTTAVPVWCLKCGREWSSKHKVALRKFNESRVLSLLDRATTKDTNA